MNSPLYGLHSLNHNSNVSTAPQASSFFTSSSSMSTARMDMSSDGPPTPEMDIIVVDPRKSNVVIFRCLNYFQYLSF